MITDVEHSRLTGDVIVTAAGEFCFHCGEPTHDPAITWAGASGEIYLHAVCAVELSIRMLRDVHELEHRTGARLTWTDPR